MDFRQKYSLDAMRRAQGFLDTNTAVLGTVNSSGARAELDDAVAQLSAQAASQDANKVAAQGTTSLLGALRNTLRQTNMRPIAQVAKARLSTVPQFSALQLPDPKIDNQGLITAAEAMGTAAAQYQDTFTGLGLPPDFLNQLQAAANAVQGAVNTRADYKVSGVGATAGASAQIRRGRHAIDLLDSLVVPLLANNAQLLASWRNAKRVVNKPGVAAKGSTPTPAPTPTPTPTPVPTPIVGPTGSTTPPIPADVPARTASPVRAVTQAA